MTTNGHDEDDGFDADLWASAKSLADLGELVAQWCEGRIGDSPFHGRVDAETLPLVADLASFNRSGFVTNFSQPGEAMDGWYQRAAVSGYCSEELAEAIVAACLPLDLICLHVYPSQEVVLRIPISRDDTEAVTWCGWELGPDDLLDQWHRLQSPEALRAVLEADRITVFDPHWGRNDLLWPTLRLALGLYRN